MPPDAKSHPYDTPQAGDDIAGKYQVEQVLGAGGMGVVVAARHRLLGQRVAIKFMRAEAALDENAVERFLREARAAVALSSEHVARVIDVAQLGTGAPYIVMEYLAGVDLSQVLRRDGPLPIAVAVDFVLQACEAIAEAHRLGIVHRDLKPANLFVVTRDDGRRSVKVLDFGISKGVGGGMDVSRGLTASGMIMGSPSYMSPEQVRSAKGADARSDIWSLGVILYEILAGISPFEGETLGDTFAKISSEDPPPLRDRRPDVPAGLEATIRRCLERRVAARIATVEELASNLRPFVAGAGWMSDGTAPATASRTLTVGLPAPGMSFGDLVGTPVGTERPWLRSGATGARAPGKPWVAIGAGVALLATALGIGVRYAGSGAARPPIPVTTAAPSEQAEPARQVVPAAPPVAPLPASPSIHPPPAPPASTEEATPSTPPASVSQSPRAISEIAKPRAVRPVATATRAAARPEASIAPGPSTPHQPPSESAEPANCNPPYVIDSAGRREYKPECL